MDVIPQQIFLEPSPAVGAIGPAGVPAGSPPPSGEVLSAAEPFSFILARATVLKPDRPPGEAPEGALDLDEEIRDVASDGEESSSPLFPNPATIVRSPLTGIAPPSSQLPFPVELSIRPQVQLGEGHRDNVFPLQEQPVRLTSQGTALDGSVKTVSGSVPPEPILPEESTVLFIRQQTPIGERPVNPQVLPANQPPPLNASAEAAGPIKFGEGQGDSTRVSDLLPGTSKPSDPSHTLTGHVVQGNLNATHETPNGPQEERVFPDMFAGQREQKERQQQEHPQMGYRESGAHGVSVAGSRVEPFSSLHTAHGLGRAGSVNERPPMPVPSAPPNIQMDVTLPDATRVQIDVAVQHRQVMANLVMDQLALRNLAIQHQGQLETQLASMGLELRDFGAEFQHHQGSQGGERSPMAERGGYDREFREKETLSEMPMTEEDKRPEYANFYLVA